MYNSIMPSFFHGIETKPVFLLIGANLYLSYDDGYTRDVPVIRKARAWRSTMLLLLSNKLELGRNVIARSQLLLHCREATDWTSVDSSDCLQNVMFALDN